jgi:hypothetical protein
MALERISLGAVWQETADLMRAEAALVMPVALAAFGLPVVLLQLAIPANLTPETPAGPWMWALLPYVLASMIGSMTISALALRGGISVREALSLALRRIPVAAGVAIIVVAALFGLMLVASIAAGIEYAALGHMGPIFAIAMLGLLTVTISLLVRILPVWAMIADGLEGPLAVLGSALHATRGRYLRLLLLRVVAWLSQTLILLVLWVPLIDIIKLAGAALNAAPVAEMLALVAGGLVMSGILATWTVYVARLSRRLTSNSGT